MSALRIRAEETVLACCLPLLAIAAAASWMLRRPTSWLSRRVDRAVTWPAP